MASEVTEHKPPLVSTATRVVLGFLVVLIGIEYRSLLSHDSEFRQQISRLESTVATERAKRESHDSQFDRFIAQIGNNAQRLNALEILVAGIRSGDDEESDRFTNAEAIKLERVIAGAIGSNRKRIAQLEVCCFAPQE